MVRDSSSGSELLVSASSRYISSVQNSIKILSARGLSGAHQKGSDFGCHHKTKPKKQEKKKERNRLSIVASQC